MIAVAPFIAFVQPAASGSIRAGLPENSNDAESDFEDLFALVANGDAVHDRADQNLATLPDPDDKTGLEEANLPAILISALWQPTLQEPVLIALPAVGSEVKPDLANPINLQTATEYDLAAKTDPAAANAITHDLLGTQDTLPDQLPDQGRPAPAPVVVEGAKSAQPPENLAKPFGPEHDAGSARPIITEFASQTQPRHQTPPPHNNDASDLLIDTLAPVVDAPKDISAANTADQPSAVQKRPDPEGKRGPLPKAGLAAPPAQNLMIRQMATGASLPVEHIDTLVELPDDPANLPSSIQVKPNLRWGNQTISTVETAWRQKWSGETANGTLLTASAPADATTPISLATKSQGSPPFMHSTPAIGPAHFGIGPAHSTPDAGGGPHASHHGVAENRPVLPSRKAAPQAETSAPAIAVFHLAAQDLPSEAISFGSAELGIGVAAATTLPANPANPPSGISSQGLPPIVSPALVEMARLGKQGPFELTLSPEELGRLTISMKQDGDFVHVTVHAERPETLDLMRRHSHELVADLRQAGFSGASLNFGQGGKSPQGQLAGSPPEGNSPSGAALSPPATNPPNSRYRRTHHLRL